MTTDRPDGGPRPPEPAAARATLLQLRALRRARVRRLILAAGALSGGVVLATLPAGRLLVFPATLLFVLGLLAVPVAAHLLLDVHRQVVEREREAADRRG